MPLIMYKIKKYLSLKSYQCSRFSEDGRINSNFDEENIINFTY